MKLISCGSIHIPIPVLAAGKGWLVVDKPAGMTVHNKPGMDLCSFALTHVQNETAANYLKRNFAFDRLALHARALTLLLPGGKDPETIETPSIPGQMLELFENDHAGKIT